MPTPSPPPFVHLSTQALAQSVVERAQELRDVLGELGRRPIEERDRAFGTIATLAGISALDVIGIESRANEYWHHALMCRALQFPIKVDFSCDADTRDPNANWSVRITWNGHSAVLQDYEGSDDLREDPARTAHLLGAFVSPNPSLAIASARALAEGREVSEEGHTALDRAYGVLCDFVADAICWCREMNKTGSVQLQPSAARPMVAGPSMMAP